MRSWSTFWLVLLCVDARPSVPGFPPEFDFSYSARDLFGSGETQTQEKKGKGVSIAILDSGASRDQISRFGNLKVVSFAGGSGEDSSGHGSFSIGVN